MTAPPTRRALLLALASAPLTGCLGAADDAPSDVTTDDPQMTDTDDSQSADRRQQVEQLPEPSPLSDDLTELFLADDRESVAQQRDLTLRDGAVQVEIALTANGDPPTEYLPEERSEYGDTVIAYVAVGDLVDLALDDDVKRVTRRFEPQPT
ncbi:hypothetical protein [Halapricum salinum]|uniref:Uncharacterized protein n=1 Tax=Halapricum salinum TaxID=1457250 RepID=A0A4D6HEM8_9EURY|nr:hypothetical protein [Halapricum salinum]QCC51746.1 hypothetical protein DV733_11085 [Halapricum salinum]